MHTITFYSFKGGVGRTMALVNVAAELVKWGRKVLVVDFDLEAPGLETYKPLQPKKPHLGIVEYVTKFDLTYQVPDIHDYVYETEPIGDNGGRLWVMPAGRRDSQYRRDLVKLNWKLFYKEKEGFLFFEETKKAWEEEFKPDYILIDSRTGDTDVLGICTRQLPDSVVLLFVPNEQNLAGLENVCRDIRREEKEGLKKKIKLHFVAANVPDLDDEEEILSNQLQAFRERLNFTDLSGEIRRYESLRLLDQSVVVLDRPKSRLARTYHTLAKTLVKDNLTDKMGAMLNLEEYAQNFVPKIEYDVNSAINRNLKIEDRPKMKGQPISDRLVARFFGREPKPNILQAISLHFLDDVDIFNMIAECHILEGEYGKALLVLDRVLQLQSSLSDALFRRALCKANLGQKEPAAEDFLTFLRILERNIERDYFVLHKLDEIAPDRTAEAIDVIAAQGDWPHFFLIAGYSKQLLEKLVARIDEEALRGMREGEVDFEPDFIDCLVHAYCWSELIELYENGPIFMPFFLALAHWGLTGELPLSLCQPALEECQDSLEKTIWLQWRLGNISVAMKGLEELEHQAKRFTTENLYSHVWMLPSPWRFAQVSLEQFLADCQLVRRVFQGEPLRPAFLGPAPIPPPS